MAISSNLSAGVFIPSNRLFALLGDLIDYKNVVLPSINFR